MDRPAPGGSSALGTEAHLHYADALLDTDPQVASDLLDEAIALDRYNEKLYVHAMQARHTLHDTDGIRILTRALTKRSQTSTSNRLRRPSP